MWLVPVPLGPVVGWGSEGPTSLVAAPPASGLLRTPASPLPDPKQLARRSRVGLGTWHLPFVLFRWGPEPRERVSSKLELCCADSFIQAGHHLLIASSAPQARPAPSNCNSDESCLSYSLSRRLQCILIHACTEAALTSGSVQPLLLLLVHMGMGVKSIFQSPQGVCCLAAGGLYGNLVSGS